MNATRFPTRQMKKSEHRIMWDFLHEVWYSKYAQKYRNGSGILLRWQEGKLSKYYNEADELIWDGELQSKHKLMLNSLIPKWKIDGREEFMRLYKQYYLNYTNAPSYKFK